MDNEVKLILADLLESLAASDRRVSVLTVSLTAMREALKDVSPERFERAYARQFEELKAQGIGQSPLDTGEALLALAKRLRNQT